LTKFGQSISRLETNFINNLKSGLRFLNRSKIIVRILLFENQKLIVNSRPLFPTISQDIVEINHKARG
ncbi:IS5/IS1182 family transposase, partial [Limosilactobacillus reuteri]